MTARGVYVDAATWERWEQERLRRAEQARQADRAERERQRRAELARWRREVELESLRFRVAQLEERLDLLLRGYRLMSELADGALRELVEVYEPPVRRAA